MKTLKPYLDKVVIKMVETEETTQSGIVLPGNAKEKPQMAEVVAVGPGGLVDGKEVTMFVEVGDKVIINKYAGTEVKLDKEEYTIVKQSDILAKVEF
ncbi:MAG: co-chaperone GroES [Ruminococcaceae bacterium]|nr:co-chaperone GroES [Oscillospiraceae bacterium]